MASRVNQLSLKGRALKYLAAREHSRAELHRKLLPHAEEAEVVEHLLDELEQRGLLSAARFVESVVHRRASRFGAARIKQELSSKGVAADVMQDSLAQLQTTELDRAREVWRRRFGEAPTDAREQARHMRFLMARGFSAEVARRILREAATPD